MKKKMFWLLALLGQAGFICATAQEPDILIMAGKKYSLFSNPLEVYLAKFPGKRPNAGVRTTANWRGYVATWEIKNDRFVLADVTITLYDPTAPSGENPYRTKSVLREIFPAEGDIVPDWFSGHLIIPDGELKQYVHMGYGSLYEKYIILKIVGGMLLATQNLSADGFIEFRKIQYAAFKKTEEYRKEFEKLKKGSLESDDATIDSFMFEYFSSYYTSRIFDDPGK